MKKYIFGLVAAVALSASVNTAKAEVEVTGGVDLVTSTVWRGGQAAAGPSLQPAATIAVGGLSVTGWASQTIGNSDSYSELDYTVAYGIGGLCVAYTNYWWTGTGMGDNYFAKGSHFSEVTVAYEFGESFPLAISWNTMVAGDTDVDEAGDQYYSTYIGLSYPFAIGSVDCAATVGLTPWTGMYTYESEGGFQVASIGLNFSKNLVETENFTLPFFVDASFSPAAKNAYLVAGLSFGF
ncbi:MAG: hypothetical protein SNH55_04870 [Rikenellaceae bacterium]